MERKKMNTNKKTARIVGILFLLGFSGAITAKLTGPILKAQDYLVQVSANEFQILLGVFFQFIMAVACAGIGISLYPIIKKYNPGLAIGAVGFRIFEAMFHIIGAIFIMLLLSLSEEFVKVGTQDSSYFHTVGSLLFAGKDWVNNVAVLLTWCIGALMYYIVFYKTKLVPRWLSIWGIIGVTLCMIASVLVMFRVISPFGSIQVVMNGPIALQELVLAVWLIVKGFNSSPSTSGSISSLLE